MSKRMTFDRLFLDKEFQTIKGASNRSILLLTAILLFTFLALGHVLGGFKKLKKSMNNPYTNWVNVGDDYHTKRGGGNKKLQEDIDALKVEFDITSVKAYQRHYLTAFTKGMVKEQRIEMRNVALDDPMYEVIVARENIIYSYENTDAYCGLIITQSTLDRLGGSPEGVDNYIYTIYDTGDKYMNYPIKYIVKELPNDVDVVISDRMMALYQGGGPSGFYDTNKSRKISFLAKQNKEAEYLNELEQVISTDIEGKVNILGDDYIKVSCFTEESKTITERTAFQNEIAAKSALLPYQEYQCEETPIDFDEDYFSYNFNSLDKIRAFKKHAKSFGVTVPIHQVEAKDNFVIVSNIAWTFILLLIMFSAATVILFINNILKNHLEKIKSNLGTLKAFGLSEKRIKSLYLKIVIRFYIIAAAGALVLTIIYYFIMKSVFGKAFLFDMWNPIYIILYGVILIIIIAFFTKMIKNILFKSPGDLIYNR